MLQAVLSDRQRFLLLVLYLASKHVREKAAGPGELAVPSRIRVMKLVFLLQKECSRHVEKLVGSLPYVFEPYLHGPFSKEVLSDLEELERNGFVVVRAEPMDIYGMAVRYVYVLTEKGVAEAEKTLKQLGMNSELRTALNSIEELVRKYASMTTDELLGYVYRNYPEDSTPMF